MSETVDPKSLAKGLDPILVDAEKGQAENLPQNLVADLQVLVSKFHQEVEALTAKNGVTLKTVVHFELPKDI